MSDPVTELERKLLNSRKYRDVCPDTIRRIWRECLPKYRQPSEAEKAARKALHGITGAFMTPDEVSRLKKAMTAWHSDAPSDAALTEILACHASTRERLPLYEMDAVWHRLAEICGFPQTALDLACGIYPIYLGARGIIVTGVDISGQAVGCVNNFAAHTALPVSAVCSDLLWNGIPETHCDIALLFKILPLIERQQQGASDRILNAIDARFIAVSFPTRTLGGRNVGMERHYDEWMRAHMPDQMHAIEMFEAKNEVFYVLQR